MNKEELTEKIMRGLRESLNESKALDLKENKDHKAAYNSFVKWYNRWKEKLGREEIRALVKKVSNDALGDNLDMINESGIPGPEDDHLAFDLFLTFQNTRELYDLSRPMVNNLINRLRKGEKLSIGVLAASSPVEKYAKATIEEYRRINGRIMVNTSTRKNLKRRIANRLYYDAQEEYAIELYKQNKQ